MACILNYRKLASLPMPELIRSSQNSSFMFIGMSSCSECIHVCTVLRAAACVAYIRHGDSELMLIIIDVHACSAACMGYNFVDSRVILIAQLLQQAQSPVACSL